jgi:hypothetical protein
MKFDVDHLYELLPAIYRIRDGDQGESLKALLSVIAEQTAVLEENLDQYYDDQFIETCAEWVVPYIGDLIGNRTLHGVAPRVTSRRAEVANTIAYRRRKGTATMLEQLARDVTGWPARVVEFFQLLATTQFMNHLRPQNHYAPDLRQWENLERLNTAFDSVAHTVEVRRIATDGGRYNIPNIGIFLWRLGAYPLEWSPAVALFADRRFMFSPLGNNTTLFTDPVPEETITHLAEPINVSMPISRRVLDKYLDRYYGEEKSLYLRVDGVDIDISNIMVCNLSTVLPGSDWAHTPVAGTNISIDPVLGRIVLGAAYSVNAVVEVFYHYGFSADTGGGEYERADSFDATLPSASSVHSPDSIQGALDVLGGAGAVEVEDSGRYTGAAAASSITVNAAARIELRAANESRPTLVLPDELLITGGANSAASLNGLLISENQLRVPADSDLEHLRLSHCSLVPGRSLDIDGEPVSPALPSLVIESPNVTVEIDRCILGGLRVVEGASVKISNSIIDATDETGVAYAALDGAAAGGVLEIVNCTVNGKMHTRILQLASNTIFNAALLAGDSWAAPLHSEQTQSGCVRFSYVPPGSIVPRRYRCQPDLAIEKAIKDAEQYGVSLSEPEKQQITDWIQKKIEPVFTDNRYGKPAYAQLALSCPKEITRGADDESEMGAFHDLYQPQRESDLQVRLDEYLRYGLQAGIFYVN